MQQTFSEFKMKCDKRKYRCLQRRCARLMMSDICFTKVDIFKRLKTARNYKR